MLNIRKIVCNGVPKLARGFGTKKEFSTEGATLQKAFIRSVKNAGTEKPVSAGINGTGAPKSVAKDAAPVVPVEKKAATDSSADKKDIKAEENTPLASPKSEDVIKNMFSEPAAHPRAQFSQGYIQEFAPRICVVGVGGGGCNAVNNMIARGLSGVEFICANTDAQHLSATLTDKRLQLGRDRTSGLGCGANPEVLYPYN